MKGDIYVPSPSRSAYPDAPVDLKHCRAMVRGGWHYVQCGNPGKFEENGMKWCGHHMPSKIRAKEEKREATYQKRRRKTDAVYEVRDAWRNIAAVAVAHFDQKATFDDLEKAVNDWRKANAINVKLQGKDDG